MQKLLELFQDDDGAIASCELQWKTSDNCALRHRIAASVILHALTMFVVRRRHVQVAMPALSWEPDSPSPAQHRFAAWRAGPQRAERDNLLRVSRF